MAPSRFLAQEGPIAFAHRGGAADGLENTMVAFQAAVDLGFRYLETDAHLTADGVVVAFHDAELDRVTDRRGRIAELTWAEVARARVGGREPVPRLDELLGAFPDVRVNIDAKDDPVVDPLIEVVTRVGAVDRVCLASFSDRRIARMRLALPDVVTNIGSRGVGRLRTGLGAAGIRGECAQVPPSVRGVPIVTERFVDRAHRLGLVVHVWTIDDADEMVRLLDLGVDGIMTDRPAVLRDTLRSRRSWPD